MIRKGQFDQSEQSGFVQFAALAGKVRPAKQLSQTGGNFATLPIYVPTSRLLNLRAAYERFEINQFALSEGRFGEIRCTPN